MKGLGGLGDRPSAPRAWKTDCQSIAILESSVKIKTVNFVTVLPLLDCNARTATQTKLWKKS
jgi:hypothetical protein